MDAQRRRSAIEAVVTAAVLAGLAACATRRSIDGDAFVRPPAYNRPYTVRGRTYTPAARRDYDEIGMASWYGHESGERTSNGERFTLEGMTAAHRTLPIPSVLEVTNLANGRRIQVRLNDRGPFKGDRLLDLSREAARRLGFLDRGAARVRVRYVGPARLTVATNEIEPDSEVGPSIGAGLRAPTALQEWVVRIGAFSDPAHASRAAAVLASLGQARVSAVEPTGGGGRYRVTVTPGDGSSADEARRRAVALGYAGARVFSAD